MLVAILAVAILGVFAAERGQRAGKKDASEVIIDEVAGQWILLVIIPFEVNWYIAAFLVFRFFDISKIGPVGHVEKFNGGVGVMADDLVAGILAALVLWPSAISMVHAMKRENQKIAKLAENIINKAQHKSIMIALAESCTGGMIAAALTDISGSSTVLDRGFVTYSNQAKIDILGVSNSTLEHHGAVSEQTARAMVKGTLIAAPLASLALSVTGIAGPGGGSPDKPVGLVHIACQRRDAPTHAMHIFSGDRHMVRKQAVHTALIDDW